MGEGDGSEEETEGKAVRRRKSRHRGDASHHAPDAALSDLEMDHPHGYKGSGIYFDEEDGYEPDRGMDADKRTHSIVRGHIL
jgi:hypothetical protein